VNSEPDLQQFESVPPENHRKSYSRKSKPVKYVKHRFWWAGRRRLARATLVIEIVSVCNISDQGDEGGRVPQPGTSHTQGSPSISKSIELICASLRSYCQPSVLSPYQSSPQLLNSSSSLWISDRADIFLLDSHSGPFPLLLPDRFSSLLFLSSLWIRIDS
jgi:hypothetical protein